MDRLATLTFHYLYHVVIVCFYRSRKLQTLEHPTKTGLPISGIPVQCCAGGFGSSNSPGGPLSSLAALNAFAPKEWDQVSVYSNRSIPRPQVYHMERQGKAIYWK